MGVKVLNVREGAFKRKVYGLLVGHIDVDFTLPFVELKKKLQASLEEWIKNPNNKEIKDTILYVLSLETSTLAIPTGRSGFLVKEKNRLVLQVTHSVFPRSKVPLLFIIDTPKQTDDIVSHIT